MENSSNPKYPLQGHYVQPTNPFNNIIALAISKPEKQDASTPKWGAKLRLQSALTNQRAGSSKASLASASRPRTGKQRIEISQRKAVTLFELVESQKVAIIKRDSE